MKAFLLEREEKEYDEFLDEVYGIVKVCEYEYNTSQILKEVDPTAYRCGFVDWLDSEEERWICSICYCESDNEEEAENCCSPENEEE